MKKSNLIKMFSILSISVLVITFCTSVFAAETTADGFQDMTSTLTNNTNNNANTNTNTNTNVNTNTNTSKNTNKTNTTADTNSLSNNTTIYNNTNLPKTGIEDSIPVAMLVVVFGISAVYAYKKINDYKNI